MWLWKAYDSCKKRVVGFTLGGRDDGTLKKLLAEIGIEDRLFITDDFEAYHRCIPENQLLTGKNLTFPIEQDNSNTRHYLARFRRKSKVSSRSLEMVDLSLILLNHLLIPENIAPYLNIFQSSFR